MSFQANGLTLTANDAIIYLESELKIQISPIQKQVLPVLGLGINIVKLPQR